MAKELRWLLKETLSVGYSLSLKLSEPANVDRPRKNHKLLVHVYGRSWKYRPYLCMAAIFIESVKLLKIQKKTVQPSINKAIWFWIAVLLDVVWLLMSKVIDFLLKIKIHRRIKAKRPRVQRTINANKNLFLFILWLCFFFEGVKGDPQDNFARKGSS